MQVTVYGIPNCDTVKKARRWLAAQRIDYAFHDYKKVGVDVTTLEGWVADKGWEVLLNTRGTTFRKLDNTDKADIDSSKAVTLMFQHTSIIKRPVVEYDGGLLVGFKEEEWGAAFS